MVRIPRKKILDDPDIIQLTYQQDPAHCGIVFVSRLAGFPEIGSIVLTCKMMHLIRDQIFYFNKK